MNTDKNRTLVLIPARSGSKGIPGKNIKLLGNIPLIYYSIDFALSLFAKENICVSTDSTKISKICQKRGIDVPFLRPANLATDTASSRDVILHALKFYEEREIYYKSVLLLQPTSPLRKKEHIKNAFKISNNQVDMVVSVNKSNENPYFNLFEENSKGYLEKSKKGLFNRRQDCPLVYKYNGSIYLINRKSIHEKEFAEFTKIKKMVMEENFSLDLDTPLDWIVCESILKKIKLDFIKK